MNDRELLRYSRHILLEEIGIEGQQKLQNARIALIGCGGLGTAAAPLLAAAGAGRLILADGDTVEESNLQRQTAFSESDIGRNKAEALSGRLKALNSACRIEAIPRFVNDDTLPDIAASADILLDCSDNFTVRQAVNRAAFSARKPLVSGAAVRFDGQLAVYRHDLPDSPCYACFNNEDTAGSDGACALFGVFAPLVGIIGSMQAAEALKILAGCGSTPAGRLTVYQALSGRFDCFDLPKNPACRVCGRPEHRNTP